MSSPFVELFGSDIKLQSKSGSDVSVSSLSEKKAVLLYFRFVLCAPPLTHSAHWCPPCRGFTPVLAEYYQKFSGDKNFEIIFVSSDKDQASFDEYYGEHPWCALPFPEREVKAQLSKKFKVQGIPSLVVLDSSANLITTNGRAKVMQDTECVDFPWLPETFEQIMAGDLKSKAGNAPYSSLLGNTAVGLYFSAHWCPPCRKFTPQLIETYKHMKAAGVPFEVIFVSSDQSAEEFEEYFGEMPWLAIPFGDKRGDKLSEKYDIEGIPAFIIIEPATGKVITTEGRSAVSNDPEGKEFPWAPKPLEEIEAAGDSINESACLLYLSDDTSVETKSQLEKIATGYHDTWKAAGKSRDEFPLLFFFGNVSSGLGNRVLEFTNVSAKGPTLMILDIPSGKKFVSPSADDIETFINNFLSNSLTGQGLKD